MRPNYDPLIKEVLAFDPIQTAADAAGDDGKAFGLYFVHAKRARSDQLAQITDDTSSTTTFRETEAKLIELGFSLQYRHYFKGRSWSGEEPKDEEFVLYASEDGLVGKMETCDGPNKNSNGGVDLFFNALAFHNDRIDLPVSGEYQPYDMETKRTVPGGMPEKIAWIDEKKPMVFMGHINAREFLAYRVEQLRKLKLLSPWAGSWFVQFLSYMDYHNQESIPNFLDQIEATKNLSLDRIRQGGELLRRVCGPLIKEKA